MTPYQLAFKLNLSPAAVSRMMAGERHNPATWGRIARILRVPLRTLILDEGR